MQIVDGYQFINIFEMAHRLMPFSAQYHIEMLYHLYLNFETFAIKKNYWIILVKWKILSQKTLIGIIGSYRSAKSWDLVLTPLLIIKY